jgi:hypothetical protein
MRASSRLEEASARRRPRRDHALRAAKSAVLNIAEGTGRLTRADKARVFAIARGESLEAFAAPAPAGRGFGFGSAGISMVWSATWGGGRVTGCS